MPLTILHTTPLMWLLHALVDFFEKTECSAVLLVSKTSHGLSPKTSKNSCYYVSASSNEDNISQKPLLLLVPKRMWCHGLNIFSLEHGEHFCHSFDSVIVRDTENFPLSHISLIICTARFPAGSTGCKILLWKR